MPRGKGQQRRMLPMPLPPLQPMIPSVSVRQQCCVICYMSFTPFDFDSEIWDSNMIKNFYTSLNISSSLGSGEDDEEVLSLPFCPQCHTKVSVMAAYQIELQNIKSKCNSIRNDLAFTVVKTISKNSRDGPIDYIRQQIYDKWKLTYEENMTKSTPNSKIGLEYVASDSSAVPHNCGNYICICHSSEGNGRIFNNGSQNGYGYDTMEFTDPIYQPPPQSVVAAKAIGLGKMRKPVHQFRNIEKPPLLTPHKPFFSSAHQANFRSKIVSKSLSTIQKKGNLITPAKTHVQKLNFGPGKTYISGMSVKRKSDYSQVKSKVVSRFLPGELKGKSINESLMANAGKHVEVSIVSKVDAVPMVEVATNDNAAREQISTKLKKDGVDTILTQNVPIQKDEIQENRTSGSRTRLSPRLPVKLVENALESETFIHKCTHCPKAYNLQSLLLRHESCVHPETKAFQCDLATCLRGFSSKEAYRRHLINTHKLPPNEIEAFKCPISGCRKSFIKIELLESHKKDIHGDVVVAVKKSSRKQRTQKNDTTAANDTGTEDVMKEAKIVSIIPVAIAESKNELVVSKKSGISYEVSQVDDDPDYFPNSSPKLKKKINFNRPFGIRKRRRAAGAGRKKKVVIIEDPEFHASQRKTRKRMAKPDLTPEPVRKSSRQRGVQLDIGKPMYPPLEPKSKLLRTSEEEEKSDEQESTTTNTDINLPSTQMPNESSEHLSQPCEPPSNDEIIQEKKKEEKCITSDKEKNSESLEESVILGGENVAKNILNVTFTETPAKMANKELVTSTPLKPPTVETSIENDESTMVEEEAEVEGSNNLNTTYTVDG